ncbi:MAG: hypothetical protein QM688_04175 [Sphingomonas bacterium]
MASRPPVDASDDRMLRLSGPPSSLRAAVEATTGPVSLIGVASAGGQPIAARSASVGGGRMRLRLDSATPAGRYTGKVDLAGVVRPIEIDVVETVALQIRPSPLVIDLAAGTTQRAGIQIEIRGNVALDIDLTGDYPLGEELPLFRDDSAPMESGSLTRLAHLFTGAGTSGARHVLREAGRVAITMPEGAARLEPGETRTVAIGVTLPGNLSPTARYRCFIPVYVEDLELVAVTAAKQPAAPRKRGA